MTNIQRGAVLRTANAWDNFTTGTLTATAAPVALANRGTPIMEVIIQNDPDSQEAVFVGNQYGQHWQLAAGASITIPINNLALIYVASVGGTARVNWMAAT